MSGVFRETDFWGLDSPMDMDKEDEGEFWCFDKRVHSHPAGVGRSSSSRRFRHIETLSGREDSGAPVSVSVPCVVCLPCFCSFHCFVAGRRIDRITDWDGVKTREGCVE